MRRAAGDVRAPSAYFSPAPRRRRRKGKGARRVGWREICLAVLGACGPGERGEGPKSAASSRAPPVVFDGIALEAAGGEGRVRLAGRGAGSHMLTVAGGHLRLVADDWEPHRLAELRLEVEVDDAAIGPSRGPPARGGVVVLELGKTVDFDESWLKDESTTLAVAIVATARVGASAVVGAEDRLHGTLALALRAPLGGQGLGLRLTALGDAARAPRVRALDLEAIFTPSE